MPLLLIGADPTVKTRLAEEIRRAEALIAELQPTVDASQARVDELNSQGQGIAQSFKEAKRTKQEYVKYKQKVCTQLIFCPLIRFLMVPPSLLGIRFDL